jgi:hypothetical protein
MFHFRSSRRSNGKLSQRKGGPWRVIKIWSTSAKWFADAVASLAAAVKAVIDLFPG